MHLSAFAILLLTALSMTGEAMAADSAYTVLDVDNGSCKPVGEAPTQEDIDLGVMSVVCPGYKAYPVEYHTDDERTTVHYGDPATTTTASAWESFSPFNSAAEKIEWRIDAKDGPFAAIHRFYVGSGGEDGKEPRGEVLVISKVGQPGGRAGCVVGLVDALANKDANAMAREIADRLAPGFACGKDKADYHGRRGDKAAEFQTYFFDQ